MRTLHSSCDFLETLSSKSQQERLDSVGVNITPGVGFGPHGEGFFRLSVTAPDARLEEAMARMRKLTL